ncbi:hypothetical protein VTK73DRAFT_5461 [Phialemonium thermophilum]|uniref:Uncharacterized protein n=1 Tax=Phialemonium thermophilum TaxID=223376 RepID=A0ABR3WNQ7_9PEZI
MHFTAATLFVPLSALSLALGAAAAAVPRQDPHIADFRSFGLPGCAQDNQGVWTFTQSQLTGCQTFASFGDADVQSLLVGDISDGCSLKLYTDDACSEDELQAASGSCQSQADGFKSFLLSC